MPHKIKDMYANKYFPHYGFPGIWVSFNRTGCKQSFYTEQEAKDFSEQGTATEYRGFVITSSFKIFKDHKPVFTAPWQDCDTMEKARQMIDISIACKAEESNYASFQLSKYGDIVPPIDLTPEADLFESGLEELDRLADYINAQSERQMHEKEY